MARLVDKVAIVTGGGSGIGTATVRKFAVEGATVVATDIASDAGSAVVVEIGANAVFLRHDVTDESQWETVMKETVDRFGKVDIVVNNAGIIGTGAPQDPENLSLDEMHAIGKVNVDGVLLGCKHAIMAMKDRGGAIVNLSSIAGIYATPGLVPYGASKGAVRQLTKSVAAYCGQRGYGIRCNSVPIRALSKHRWARPFSICSSTIPNRDGRNAASKSPWAASGGPRTSPMPCAIWPPTKRVS